MATVDKNLNSGVKPINISPAYVYAEKKAMPQIKGKAESLTDPGHNSITSSITKFQEESAARGRQGGTSIEMPNWLSPVAKGIGAATTPFTGLNNTVSQSTLGIRNSISDAAIQSGNPYAMAIGAATKILDAIGDATGFHIDDIDKTAGERAGVNGGIRFLNNAMNAIPGSSLLSAVFSPNKSIDAKNLNNYGNEAISAYSGTQKDIDSAKTLGNKRTLFGLGLNDINDFVRNSNNSVNIINEIGRTNALAKRSDYASNLAQQNLNRYAGTNYQMYSVGKKGMKIMSREELQAIIKTQKLQKGGTIGTDTNILPEGALHARLNHLQDANPDLEDTTRKGIPVLDESGEQVAEIEREELVLNKSLTERLEELMKDGSDEAMLEAGKILVYEILENTQDNTGQLTEEE